MCAVEWKPLSEIFEMRGGYTPSTKNADFWEDGILPWFRMEDIREKGNILSDSTLHITPIALKKNGLFPQNSIILATSATIGVHALLTVPALSNQRFTAFFPKEKYEDKINYKFAYYEFYLIDEWCKNNIVQGGFASVDMTGLKKYLFPIPSLAKQQEIVSYLDTFTTLISNLESELDMRLKQYEHYRNQLLDFEGVEIKTLDEISDIVVGFPFDSSKFVEEGIRLMRGMNIKRGYLDFDESLNKYWNTAEGLEKYDLNANDIVISMDGSLVGRSFALIEQKHLPLLLVQRVARIRTNYNVKYIYYNICMSFSDYVDKKKTAGAIPHISMKDIQNFSIPFPSLDKQAEIVSKLDAFENLIQSLEQEIKLRKQQYEYYREKLLTFE